jgi:hypothetical protein
VRALAGRVWRQSRAGGRRDATEGGCAEDDFADFAAKLRLAAEPVPAALEQPQRLAVRRLAQVIAATCCVMKTSCALRFAFSLRRRRFSFSHALRSISSFMMFGAPSHRLEAQMQATARVLEINCQVIYIPGVTA